MTEILRHGSLFGDVTDPDTERMLVADERDRQRRAIRLLGDLDEKHPGLPTIEWTVTEWSLVGAAVQHDMRDRRRAFEAWAETLGLIRHRDEWASGGVTHLRASASDYQGRRTNISVWADIAEDSP